MCFFFFVFGGILVPAYVAMLKRVLDAPKHLRIFPRSRKKSSLSYYDGSWPIFNVFLLT